MLEFNKSKVIQFVKDYKLISLTEESLKESLRYYRKKKSEDFYEVFEDYSHNLLELWLHNISIRMCNGLDLDLDRIEIVVEFRIDYDESEVGNYRAFYSEEGQCVDDVLVIY